MSNTSLEFLDCREINPDVISKHTIIWLHGLGADANDFVPIVSELNLPKIAAVRFIFPNAPLRPVTINNGYETRAWFDVHGISLNAKLDEEGIQKALASIGNIIENEISRGISADHIFIAGFSQGAAMALATGIHFPKKLGGIIALSGYIPLTANTLIEIKSANHQTPIFLAHGTDDMVVPYILGQVTCNSLQEAGYNVDWYSYPMAHSVSEAEILDISDWLKKRLA